MKLPRLLPFALLLVSLAVSAFPAWAAPSRLIANLDAGKPQTLVLYGTSETQFGRWADVTPGHGGLADWLKGLYGEKVTVFNGGMAGKASNSGVAKLDEQVVAHHPDTVILEFSVNDANTGYATTVPDYGITQEKSRANLNAMIDRIVAANPQAEIILQTMNPVTDVGGHNYGTLRPDLAAYYQIYRDVAAERGFLLVDHYANWVALQASNPSLYATYLPEGLHPTAPASLAVTLPALEKALKEEATEKGSASAATP